MYDKKNVIDLYKIYFYIYFKELSFVTICTIYLSPPIFIVFPGYHPSYSSTPEAEVLPQMHLS